MHIQECAFGLGLFSDNTYQEGYVIGIVEGPIVTREEATDYAIEPKPGLYIETQGPLRYINHSCSSNCELLGERVVVSKRAIQPGEQLFLDYSTFIYDDWAMECKCGEPSCRGLIECHHL